MPSLSVPQTKQSHLEDWHAVHFPGLRAPIRRILDLTRTILCVWASVQKVPRRQPPTEGWLPKQARPDLRRPTAQQKRLHHYQLPVKDHQPRLLSTIAFV